MAILGSIIGGAIAGGTAAGAGAGAASSALASAITAATATGASTATAAGAGSALTGALTAATSAGAAGATAGGSALTGAITAATGGVTGGAGGAAGATAGGITAAGLGKAAAVGAIKGSLLDAGLTAAQGGSTEDIMKAGVKGAATGAGTGLVSGIASGTKAAVNGQQVSEGINGLKAPAPAKMDVPGVTSGTTPGTIPGNTIKYDIPANASKVGVGTKIKQAGSTIAQSKVGQGIKTAAQSKPGQTAGKIAGQYGVQGGLSLISAGMAAKQSNAANKISQQSLLFQQQTYQEQKAEKESYKAGMKQTAQTSYDSSLLFGSNLQGSDSNSTLLTSYSTSGNGAAGDYSILTYSSSRNRDKT